MLQKQILKLTALSCLVWQIPIARADLIAHFKLDDDFSASANLATGAADSAGTAQNLTNYGAGTPLAGQPGIIGTAYQFSGADTTQVLRYTQTPEIISTFPYTLSAWIKTNTNNTAAVTVAGLQNALDNSDYALLRLESSEQGQSAFRKTGSGTGTGTRFVTDSSSNVLNNGQWHHLVSTFDESSQKFYINGKLIGESTTTRGDAYSRTLSLGGFAGTSAGQAFTGLIDDAGFWNTNLSAQEIALIHGIGRYHGLNLANSAKDSLLAIYTAQSGTLEIEGLSWEYATGLGSSVIGASGDAALGQAYIVLGADGSGVRINASPETIVAVLAGAQLTDFEFLPPADAGVVNVKDYGAVGDGVTDDTLAIRTAINANLNTGRYRSGRMFYFPNGTYLVTEPIESRIFDRTVWEGWRAGCVLIGQSRKGAIIKLPDNAVGYTSATTPKAVIAMGSETYSPEGSVPSPIGAGNQAFRHGVINLTVDVGNGNPGAIGVDFITSNRGTIDNVLIKSGPNSGHTGIAMTRSWPGPGMIMDTRIDGFNKGITMAHYQYGMTFENIRMSGQRALGIESFANVMAMRRVNFSGNVPFYQSNHPNASLTLLDSTINGASIPGQAAMANQGTLSLRRVTFSGYEKLVDNPSTGAPDLSPPSPSSFLVSNHDVGPTRSAEGGVPVSLNLPIAEIPTIRPPAGATWVNAGTTRASFQAAIDSGAEYIYIKPVTSIQLDGTLILRGNVKLIWGMQGWIRGPTNGDPAIRVADGTAPVVQMEHVYVEGPVVHESTRTFVFRHCDRGGLSGSTSPYIANSTGKSIFIDVIGRDYRIGTGHTFWGRQINSEFSTEYLFSNNGGTSWFLGYKMEGNSATTTKPGTPIFLNRDGGKLEVYGSLLYTLGNNPGTEPRIPAVTNLDGQISMSFRPNGNFTYFYPTFLETPNPAETVSRSQFGSRGIILLTSNVDPMTAGNLAPTGLTLSPNVVSEKLPSGSVVGMLAAIDPTVADDHSYAIVGGASSEFAIVDDSLRTAVALTHQAAPSYSLTIRITDLALNTLDVPVTINVIPASIADVSQNISLAGLAYSYGGQDTSGTLTISPNGASVTLAGNTMKAMVFPYMVTPNTMLQFTVNGRTIGGIIGMGLDEDLELLNGKRIFQVGGSQNWADGWPITPSYTANAPARTYTIPVGTYYTGPMNYLVFAADDDANASTSVTYTNLRIYESDAPTGYPALSNAYNWGTTPASDRAATADANGNGIANLLEFAFNLDPLTTSQPVTLTPGTGTQGLPTFGLTKPIPTLQLEYLSRRNSGLTYKAQFSSNLVDWVDVTAPPTISPINASWERHVVTPAGLGVGLRFGRVNVENNQFPPSSQ